MDVEVPSQVECVKAVVDVIHTLQSYHFCSGNEDEHFIPLLHSTKKGTFVDQNGIGYNFLSKNEVLFLDRVRNCSLC